MTHTKRPFKLLPNIPHVISNGTLEDLCCQILNLSQEEFSGNNLLKVADSYLYCNAEKGYGQGKDDKATPHNSRLTA